MTSADMTSAALTSKAMKTIFVSYSNWSSPCAEIAAIPRKSTDSSPPETTPTDPGSGWVDAANQACRDHLLRLSEIIDSQSSTAFAEMAGVVENLSSALNQLERTPDVAGDATNNLNATVERYSATQDLTNSGSSDNADAVGAQGLQFLITALTQLGNAGATDCSS